MDNNNGKLLLGLAAGVVAGAAIAILFAPEKGSVTRERIINLGKRKKDLHPGSAQGQSSSVKEDLIKRGKSESVDENNMNVW